MIKYSANSLFEFVIINEAKINNANRKIKYPFNLEFKIKTSKENSFKGPGVYAITYKKVVIYIGSYSSIKPDIVNERWKKHLMTLTNRGYRVGFTAKTKQHLIPSKFKVFFDRDEAFRLNDTGVVTTVERLTFASLHFDVFKDLSVETNLIDFDIYYYKIEDCKTNNAEKIEKDLIEQFQPSCNSIKNRSKFIDDFEIKIIKTKIDNLIFNPKI